MVTPLNMKPFIYLERARTRYTASYRSFTDISSNILRILKIHIQLKYVFVKHSNLSNSHDNKSKKRKPKAKKEEVELEIKEFVDCQAERVEPG